jgi:peptide deformylase
MIKCNLFVVVVGFVLITTISSCTERGFRQEEVSLIVSSGPNTAMPLIAIDNKRDSLFLRQKARKIRKKDMGSSTMDLLKMRMLSTVKDSLNPGLGIAAPQVGVAIQLICVQRFDKETEPFEFFLNPKVELYSDSINSGEEGCMSVPGYRGKVDRSQNINITYFNSNGIKQKETMNGFTAVVFQHEIDHLQGKLYFDHIYGGINSLTTVEKK